MTATSPFLPGTKIALPWAQAKAGWLVENAIERDGCLICHLAPNAKGYPPIGFGRAIKMRANRLVFFVSNLNIDPSLFVLHTCDVRNCIKLSHLFAGTAADNTADMMSKGRHKYISRTDHYYRDKIAALYEEGYTRLEIADKLMISPSTVWNYVSPRGPYYVG